MSNFNELKNELKSKCEVKDNIFFYLPKITEFQKKEIEFHNLDRNNEIEVHQLSSLRNQYYHKMFLKYFNALKKDSVILEVGVGIGYDLIPLLKKGFKVIASDISEKTLIDLKKHIEVNYPEHSDNIIYLVSDGQNLPLKDNSIEAILIVATLHHFEDQKKLVFELKRVLNNGYLVLGMEPSRFMMSFTKLFKNSNKLRIHEGHSEADETHNGYIKSDFKKLGKVIRIKRVWLLLGFLHYFLEAIYRLFKLKKRIKIPLVIEYILLVLDEILLSIPIVNSINFHWLVVIKF